MASRMTTMSSEPVRPTGQRVDDFAELREAADAAQKLLHLRPVVVEHPAMTVGDPVDTWFTPEHFEADDWPKMIATHLSLCSPARILQLCAVAAQAQRDAVDPGIAVIPLGGGTARFGGALLGV